MDTKNKNQTTYKLFLLIALSTSILLVSPVIILLTAGYFADMYFHTSPVYMALGGGIGFVSGIINVFRMMSMMQKRKLKSEKPKVKSISQN